MNLNVSNVYVNDYNVYFIEDDEFVSSELKRGKLWEEWIRDDIKKKYKPGTDILDIGSNIGTHTLIFSEYGDVHSFEPVYYKIVEMNVLSNNLKNKVKIYPHALSDMNEKIDLFIPKKTIWNKVNYGGTSMYPNLYTEHDQTICVTSDAHKLDDIYTGIPSIIKIDVEGAELKVLKGSINIIKKYKPVIFIEIHNIENSESDKFLRNLGYTNVEKRPDSVYIYNY